MSHWLHGVAHRVAVRARASAARRHLHEATGLNGAELVLDRTSKDDRQRELRDVLDQELARLPGTLRSPVVLCYLEGLTHDEAASRLRWPVGTVRSRLARARTRLRQRLARHGLTADGVTLSASLARPSVPQTLVNTTVRASLSFATNQTTTAIVASASAAALAKGILHTMTITKIKLIGVVVLASALTFSGVSTLARANSVTTAVRRWPSPQSIHCKARGKRNRRLRPSPVRATDSNRSSPPWRNWMAILRHRSWRIRCSGRRCGRYTMRSKPFNRTSKTQPAKSLRPPRLPGKVWTNCSQDLALKKSRSGAEKA